MTTLIKYRNDIAHGSCEVALDSGERILVHADRNGTLIERCALPGIPKAVLYRGMPDVVAEICAALAPATPPLRTTPLDIILAAVIGLGSAAKIRKAFRDASTLISDDRNRRAAT